MPDETAQKKNRYSLPLAALKNEVVCFEITGQVVAYNTVNFTKRIITKAVHWYSNYTNSSNCWLDKKAAVLWMPAERGLAGIDLLTGRTAFYFPDLSINAVLYDEKRKALLMGGDAGLATWDMSTSNPLPAGFSGLGKVTCMAKDNEGKLWVGTEEHGLFIMDGLHIKAHLKKEVNRQNSINGDKINSVFCDKSGTAWVGVATNGIDQLIPGNRFIHYSETMGRPGGLSNNIVRCFIEDGANNIWMATQGGGINIFNPGNQHFASLTTRNLPALPFDFVRFIVKDETNTAWIGTERGACRMDLRTRKTEKILFSGTNNSLLPDPYVEQIIAFENNTWLIATKEYGLFQLTKSGTTAVQLPYPGNRHVFYTAFVNHLLFISIWDDDPKFFLIENGRWTEVQKELTAFTITHVQYDAQKSSYWIGTLNGLLETDDNLHLLHQYTTDDGLSNHYIYAMVPDTGGLLWISTNKGLSQFNTVTHTFKTFTPADGLQGYEYNAKAGFRASDGSIYFGGTNGFDVIRNTGGQEHSQPAIFYIKELLVNNQPLTGPADINYTPEIRLPFSGNNITIQTGVVDFTARGNSKIRYRLQGVDDNWVVADRDFVINYSGLPPGSYSFLATAANANNAWTLDTTRLNIFIAKPWWQNGWLKAGLFIFLAGTAITLIRLYYGRKLLQQKAAFEKQQAVEQERTRIATDMHDDLGAGLSRIKFLSENIELKKAQQQPIEPELRKIKNYSHQMIDKMGEIVWALNEKNDSLSDLLSYTRAYAVEYLGQYHIACTIDAPDIIPGVFVSGEFRRNYYLAVKEALHNVVKHAAATKVTLRFTIQARLDILIEDNGKGIDPAAVSAFGNGLTNMKKRMAALNGTVQITHRNGTVVQFSAPLAG